MTPLTPERIVQLKELLENADHYGPTADIVDAGLVAIEEITRLQQREAELVKRNGELARETMRWSDAEKKTKLQHEDRERELLAKIKELEAGAPISTPDHVVDANKMVGDVSTHPDTELLKWLFQMVSGYELRRLGITYSDHSDIEEIRAAIDNARSTK
jgi:hypothetical protein